MKEYKNGSSVKYFATSSNNNKIFGILKEYQFISTKRDDLEIFDSIKELKSIYGNEINIIGEELI